MKKNAKNQPAKKQCVEKRTLEKRPIKKQSAKKRPVRKKSIWKRPLIFIFLIFFTAIIVFVGLVFLHIKSNENKTGNITDLDFSSSVPENELPEIKNIDFQPVVDSWANSVNGNKSVLIYDLEKAEIIGSYNLSKNYNTASLYKLFVVYEGYRRIESGIWQGDSRAGSTGHTILKCLDLAIRESNSPCAETLWGMIGHEELDQIIMNDFDITNSKISTLTSNAPDILKIMQRFYQHPDINKADLLNQIKDSFLIQPSTTYNWRQGLPSGFSVANVYNKVGWEYNPDGNYWNIYHDAAIIEFPEDNRHFIVVVMTNRVPFRKIRELGEMIENKYLESNTY